jgi:NAD dependent epimerase/dehydratase family enzyme
VRAQAVLEGQRVLPTRTLSAGFRYKFTDLSGALRDIIHTPASAPRS